MMNNIQNIFLVFFAIFWGTMVAALPRWKPFQLPLFMRFRPATWRVVWSMLVFNVIPLGYVALMLNILGESGGNPNEPLSPIQLVLLGVVPAFAAFGFYRFWLGVVEIVPNLFLAKKEEEVKKYKPDNDSIPAEPYQGMFYLDRKNGVLNVFYAMVYIGVAIGVPLLIR
jgi:hypothetical protein